MKQITQLFLEGESPTLNTLTFMLLMVSGTHNLAYGLLIVFQLPLHLFVLIL